MHSSHEKKPNRISGAEPNERQRDISVVYLRGELRHIPMDTDIPPMIARQGKGYGRRHLENGLTPKADAMARLVARGTTLSDAYRMAYGSKASPLAVTTGANQAAKANGFHAVVSQYREEMEGERRQDAVTTRDFVMSRLVEEAQTADNAPSRIRAVELLGKTEAMFTDVRRTEKTISAKDIQSLKMQLEQRLRTALTRLGPGLSLGLGTTDQVEGTETGELGTAPGGQPPFGLAGPPTSGDTISGTLSPDLPPPISVGPLSGPVPGGISAETPGLSAGGSLLHEMSREALILAVQELLARGMESRPEGLVARMGRPMTEGDL